MAALSLLFVHSPLLGPLSWLRTAEVVRGRGFSVAVADLTGVVQAPPPTWKALVERAVADADALPGEIVIVGHSGAGVFLPGIAGRLDGREVSLLFVDAVIPPSSGFHRTAARLERLLDEQTVDGRLRPWLDWWPEEVVRDLVPDAHDRAALRDEMVSLPRSFYDETVPVPNGWTDLPCAYLKLSEAYDAEFTEAGQRGWPRLELDADHLAIRTRPADVVAAIESLLPVPS